MEVVDKDKAVVTPITETPTTETPPVALTPEQEAAEEASFAAGFKVARGEEPHAEARPEKKDETPTAPAKVEENPAAKPAAAEAPKPEDPVIAGLGMKASEVKAALARAGEVEATLRKEIGTVRDSAMGRAGQLQQALDALKTNPTTGKPQKVTGEMLKRLTEDYPEMAAALAEDLSKLTLGAGQVDVAALEQTINARVEERVAKAEKDYADGTKAMQRNLLTMLHKDWREVYASPDFTEWKATLPPEANEILLKSRDAFELAEAFDDFKAWKANGKKPLEAAKPTAEEEAAEKEKAKRLAANAPAPSSGAPATGALLSEEDAFQAGYKSVRPKPGS